MSKRRKVRCPRCGSPPSHYTEQWSGSTIGFHADADGVPEDEGALMPGDPVSVYATCADCDAVWRVRGVRQITELRAESQP